MKINLRKKLIIASAILSLFGSISFTQARTVNFANYTWDVKETTSGTTMGPGANNWGSTVANDQNDVRVDNDNKLHLFVSQRPDGKWYSSEVILDHSLGYGKYTFDLESPVDQIDKNLVAAPFIYKNDQHELDIEYSYWQIPGSSNLHYTVQPLQAGQYNESNQLNQKISLSNSFSRNIIDWKPGSVSFSTLDGNGFSIGTGWKKYEIGDGTVGFQDGLERAHINFWQINNSVPSNSTTNELIIKAFSFEKYTPTPPADSTSSTTSTPTSSSTTLTTTTTNQTTTTTVDTNQNTVTTTTATTTETANNSLIVTQNTPLPTTTIKLNVVSSYAVKNFDLIVTACPETTNLNTTINLNAKCAIDQSGLPANWSNWGTDMFLNSLDGTSNNLNNNGFYWNWFSNLKYGQTALNKHILSPNEELLLTYDVYPLRISINTSTPTLGSTTTVTVEQFGFDSSFNPIWTLANSSTLGIDIIGKNLEMRENPTGFYNLYISSTEPMTIYAKKPWFVTSQPLVITPTGTLSLTTSTTSTTPITNNGGGGSGNTQANSLISQSTIDATVNKLINFLKSKQDNDGKIVDGNISDWATMSFAAKNIYAADVKKGDKSLYDYIYNYNFTDSSDINLCASYPRHILALLSAGTNKTDAKIINLKDKINDECVKNNKFGQNGINDDVFGLLALLALDQDANSSSVQIAFNAILSDQQPDGSFTWNGYSGADITGAVMNTLFYAKKKGLNFDNNVLEKAKQYLKNQQLPDGGWGFGTSDALTTSWAVMGINGISQDQEQWFNNSGKNPWYILTTLDNDHYTQSWDGNIDWFGTKHAIPALVGAHWPIVLDPKPTPATIPAGTSGGGTSIATTLVTTTTNIATTTVTTTINITTSTTSTPNTVVITTNTTTDNSVVLKTTVPEKKPENKPAPVISKTVKKEATASEVNPKKEAETKPEQELSAGQPQNNQNKTLDNLPLDTPTKRNAKKILAVSGGSALAVGAYLGLRLLKNVI